MVEGMTGARWHDLDGFSILEPTFDVCPYEETVGEVLDELEPICVWPSRIEDLTRRLSSGHPVLQRRRMPKREFTEQIRVPSQQRTHLNRRGVDPAVVPKDPPLPAACEQALHLCDIV